MTAVISWGASLSVTIAGVDRTGDLLGAGEIDRELDCSGLATFRLARGTAKPAVSDAVTISGIVAAPYTGVVSSVAYDPGPMCWVVHCSNQLQEYFEAQMHAPGVVSLLPTSAVWHESLFGQFRDGWECAQDAMKTIPYSIFMEGGALHVAPWAGTGYTHLIDHASGGIYDGTVRYTEASLRDILQAATATVQVRYTRLHQWTISVSWEGYQTVSGEEGGFCDWYYQQYPLPTRAMVEQVAASNGWALLGGVTCTGLPTSGAHCGQLWDLIGGWQGPDAGGFLWLNWNYGSPAEMVHSANWKSAKRWSQTITETYELSVSAAGAESGTVNGVGTVTGAVSSISSAIIGGTLTILATVTGDGVMTGTVSSGPHAGKLGSVTGTGTVTGPVSGAITARVQGSGTMTGVPVGYIAGSVTVAGDGYVTGPVSSVGSGTTATVTGPGEMSGITDGGVIATVIGEGTITGTIVGAGSAIVGSPSVTVTGAGTMTGTLAVVPGAVAANDRASYDPPADGGAWDASRPYREGTSYTDVISPAARNTVLRGMVQMLAVKIRRSHRKTSLASTVEPATEPALGSRCRIQAEDIGAEGQVSRLVTRWDSDSHYAGCDVTIIPTSGSTSGDALSAPSAISIPAPCLTSGLALSTHVGGLLADEPVQADACPPWSGWAAQAQPPLGGVPSGAQTYTPGFTFISPDIPPSARVQYDGASHCAYTIDPLIGTVNIT